MKKLITTFCLIFLTVIGFAQDSKAIEVLEVEVYKSHIAKEPKQFVDVRTPKEYTEGHIKGAENIDFLAEGFLEKMEKFDKEIPVYIYCRSGNRSAKAAAQLYEIGFKNIIDLQGGYKDWKKFEQE